MIVLSLFAQEFFHTILSLAKQCINTPEPCISEELVRVTLALGDIMLNRNIPQQVRTVSLFEPHTVKWHLFHSHVSYVL
jgi:hypothetical protein